MFNLGTKELEVTGVVRASVQMINVDGRLRIAEIKDSATEAPPSVEVMLAITELAEMQLESTTALELALAEITEIITGGVE